MSVYNILWCFLCLQTVRSELNLLADPCLVTDIECITKTTQNFLDNTSGGIPQFDIKPLDPITIPSLDVTPEGVGLTLHLKNIVVNGFKDQKISSFKLEKNTKAVDLKTKIDVVFNSDLTVELHKPSKSLSGTVNGKGTAEGGAQYSYNIRTDDKGVEHYEVGPETNSCEALSDPEFTLSPELAAAIKADADFNGKTEAYNAVANKTRRQIICDIVKTVYVTAVHNIRASARIMPKSAYFKDV